MRRLDSLLQRDLTAMAARDGEQVEVDGAIYLRHEPGTVRYFTLVGAFDIERWTYREIGVRNGPTLVPLEREVGLVEQTTPALGFRIALGYAKDHMRSCAEDMTADHRCRPVGPTSDVSGEQRAPDALCTSPSGGITRGEWRHRERV